MKRSRAAIGTALVTSTLTSLALLAGLPSATAADWSEEILAEGLIGPLQMDIDEDRVIVAQSFAGLLTEVTDGGREVLHEEEGFELAGVAIEDGDIAFVATKNPPPPPEEGEEPPPFKPAAFLKLFSDGEATKIADLRAYEKQVNPDGHVTYGFKGLSDRCESKLPEQLQSYKGIVDAHPYGLADAPGGGWYVADAAGNSILRVKPNGNTKTVAVLPRQNVKVTEAMQEAMDLPACLLGEKYGFEAVPTDVEVAKNGSLVVSLLPGGPEEASLGERGKVVRVNPTTGKSTTLAKGLLGATNVAIGKGGVIYASELMAGKITAIDGDAVYTHHETGSPAALEFVSGSLFATINVFGDNASLVRLTQQRPVVD